MKFKILSLGVLTLAGWALTTCNASAFSLLPQCFHHKQCPRPYNAFSPVENCKHGCCGCRCCGCGCCPGPICGSFSPMCTDMGCMAAPGYPGAGPATVIPGPAIQAPVPGNPGFTPPPPTPSSLFNQTSMYGSSQMVQPAGYYPSFPMNYYPANNNPMVPSTAAPYYWYNGR